MFRIEALLVLSGLKTWKGSWGLLKMWKKSGSHLSGISELISGSGQFGEACAWHGQTPQAGQGWFVRVPLEGAHSS